MAEKPILILVNGAPGTGKTTLSRKLAKDLTLPCLSKDDVKELLFDKMGVGDLKWSQDLGAGVAEMLFVFIDRWIGRGRSLIAENAYYRQFAVPRFENMIGNNDVVFVEVYCKTDPEVRWKRFVARNESGERHPGHVDHKHYPRLDPKEDVQTTYAPLRVGKVLELDTTAFEESNYRELLKNIRICITSQQKEGEK